MRETRLTHVRKTQSGVTNMRGQPKRIGKEVVYEGTINNEAFDRE